MGFNEKGQIFRMEVEVPPEAADRSSGSNKLRIDSAMDKLRSCGQGLARATSLLSISRKAAATLFLLAFFDSFLICK